MSLLHRNRMEVKLGEYLVGPATALVDPMLQARAQDYRRQSAARMMPMEANEIRERLPSAEYHVSLKVDGEFDILAYADGEILTVNPGGTVRTGLPFMKEAADLIKKAGIKKAIFAGEFHFVRPDGKRPRVHDVSRVARQPASQAEVDGLQFAAFDIIEVDGAPPPDKFDATWKQLTKIFGAGKRCNVVDSVMLKDAAEVEKQFKKWVDKGAEGTVVRSDAAGSFKIKPRHTLDAVVIGFTEGTEDRSGMIHDLLLAMMRADGCLQVLGHVGGGFSEADRRGFLSDLKDMIVKSDYVEVNDQVAYHMVRPEWVVEISVLDLISQTTRGLSINKMALNWNTAEQRFENIRRLPLVGLISPQYIRRREDKSVNTLDIRIQQVADIVEVALVDRDARKLNLPQSTVLRREVYTKQMKGQTMVRKLVMWQTNKEKETEDFPAFVVHFTDYSPNRKTPLERDIRVSSSREQIDDLWQELVTENISKGWVLTGGTAPAAVAAAAPAPKKKASPSKKKGP
jgi:ATP dependent DNA ligase C terminal region/ATP dependent DNA ligase domain